MLSDNVVEDEACLARKNGLAFYVSEEAFVLQAVLMSLEEHD